MHQNIQISKLASKISRWLQRPFPYPITPTPTLKSLLLVNTDNIVFMRKYASAVHNRHVTCGVRLNMAEHRTTEPAWIKRILKKELIAKTNKEKLQRFGHGGKPKPLKGRASKRIIVLVTAWKGTKETDIREYTAVDKSKRHKWHWTEANGEEWGKDVNGRCQAPWILQTAPVRRRLAEWD